MCQPHGFGKGQDRQCPQRRDQRAAAQPFPQQGKKGREDQIELLLDRQGPAMQQGLQDGAGGEIAFLLKEVEIRRKQHGGKQAERQPVEVIRGSKDKARDKHCRKHRKKCRKYPPDAPFIKPRDRHVSFGQFGGEDSGDQIAGDDEKDIDADEAPGQAKPKVEKDNRQDRDTAKTVDVGAIAHGFNPAVGMCVVLNRWVDRGQVRRLSGWPFLLPPGPRLAIKWIRWQAE